MTAPLECCRRCGHAKTIDEVERLDLCAECTARLALAVSDLAAVLAGEKPVGWWG